MCQQPLEECQRNNVFFTRHPRAVLRLMLLDIVEDIRVGRVGVRYGGPDGDDALLRGAFAQGAWREQRGGRGSASPSHHHCALGRAQPCCQNFHAHIHGENIE